MPMVTTDSGIVATDILALESGDLVLDGTYCLSPALHSRSIQGA
jgi:hypothetical protein